MECAEAEQKRGEKRKVRSPMWNVRMERREIERVEECPMPVAMSLFDFC